MRGEKRLMAAGWTDVMWQIAKMLILGTREGRFSKRHKKTTQRTNLSAYNTVFRCNGL